MTDYQHNPASDVCVVISPFRGDHNQSGISSHTQRTIRDHESQSGISPKETDPMKNTNPETGGRFPEQKFPMVAVILAALAIGHAWGLIVFTSGNPEGHSSSIGPSVTTGRPVRSAHVWMGRPTR